MNSNKTKKQRRFLNILFISLFLSLLVISKSQPDSPDESDTAICGGFLKFSEEYPELKKKLDYSKIQVQSFTKDMILKETSTLAASGYYFIPVSEIRTSLIIKISGPYGMTFEPEQYTFDLKEGETIKDYCNKDYDFKFVGFEIDGQISTFGVNEGPKGIKLGIFNSEGKKLETTATTEGGFFKFKPLYPDKNNYLIKPLEKEYMKGYELKGKTITNMNEPMPNILVAIYSLNKDVVKDYICTNKENISNQNKPYIKQVEILDKAKQPFCIGESNKEGVFSFKNIPYGEFVVKTYKINKYTNYYLFPEEQKIFVKHSDIDLDRAFRVNSFNIYGKVLNGKKKGISNVTIKLDGQIKAIT